MRYLVLLLSLMLASCFGQDARSTTDGGGNDTSGGSDTGGGNDADSGDDSDDDSDSGGGEDSPAEYDPLVSVGYRFSCAALSDASMKCWGENTYGQLGQGDTNSRGDNAGELGDSLTAIDLGSGRTAKAISAGVDHACALLNDNTVKCWGSNLYGQLGLADADNRGDDPDEMGDNLNTVSLGAGRTAKAIAAGGYHSCAILDNDTVKCWGRNTFGQLGLADADNRGDDPNEMGDNLSIANLETEIDFSVEPKTAKSISAGLNHTCVVLDDNNLKCWGDNSYGQLGQGDTQNRADDTNEMGEYLYAIELGTGRTAKSVSAGNNLSCAILDDGSVKCWGNNDSGGLGDENFLHLGDGPGEMGDNLDTVSLGTARTATSIQVGYNAVCAILDNSDLKCWGLNSFGQLGQGNTNNLGDNANEMGDDLDPVLLGSGRSASSVSLGGAHMCAVLDNDDIKCWGSGFQGQLGSVTTGSIGDQPGEMGDNLTEVDLGT